MEKIQIATKNAPEAIGPYSQAIEIGDMVFTSGQIPIDPQTGAIVEGGIEAQAHQVFKNLSEVLKAAGCTLNDAVKVVVFVKDIGDFAKLNEVYATYFEKPYPARSCVEVARLPKDVLLEIEIIAHKK